MGTLLISSLIIFPALTSKRLFTNFKRVVISSVIVASIAFTTAFFFFSEFSSAASIVVVNLVLYIISVFVYLIKKKFIK
jgi:zinc transport system permease protein